MNDWTCDIKIKELLTDESKWTTGVMARDEIGFQVGSSSPDACKFCLLGAVFRCYTDKEEHEKTLILIRSHLHGIGIVAWNDAPERTFQEVKDLVERLDV